MRFINASFVLSAVAVGSLCGQSVLSVNSGLVHYAQGNVYIADHLYEPKNGHFTSLKNGEELRTEDGLAEILLSPGSYVRVAENSTIRMVSNKLADTRIELVNGEALVERVEFYKDKAAADVKGNLVTMVSAGASTLIPKSGIVEFRTDPARVRVYEGEAQVAQNGTQLTLKKGKETLLSGALMATKFNSKDGDELYRWSERRSGVLALANVSAARQVSSNGYGSSYSGLGGLGLYGLGWGMLGSGYSPYGYGLGFGGYGLGGYGLGGGLGGWAYNPWYGMYTFVPSGGYAYSPFGYNYFSPATVSRVYNSYYNFAPVRNYNSPVIPHNYASARNVGGAAAAPRSAAALSHSIGGGHAVFAGIIWDTTAAAGGRMASSGGRYERRLRSGSGMASGGGGSPRRWRWRWA